MQADPSYVPLRTGLIAQVEALGAVRGASWEAWWLTFSIGVLFSVLELSALLMRMFFAAPSPAGVFHALDNTEAVEAAVARYQAGAARRAADRRFKGEFGDVRRDAGKEEKEAPGDTRAETGFLLPYR